MRRRNFVLRIDELVLHGVDPRDRRRIAEALQRELDGRAAVSASAQPTRLARRVATAVARRAG